VHTGEQPMVDGGVAVRRVGKRRVAAARDPQASCTGVLRRGARTAGRRPTSACGYGKVRRRRCGTLETSRARARVPA
jgi:hypothetical protein